MTKPVFMSKSNQEINVRKGPKPVWIYLVSSARKIWRWSHERKEIKKTENCAYCSMRFTNNNSPEVDHMEPIGKAPRSICGDAASFKGWDRYYSRLFVPKNQLQALCHKCHKAKSTKERKKL